MGPRQAGVPFQLIRVGATHERRKKMKKWTGVQRTQKFFQLLKTSSRDLKANEKQESAKKLARIWSEKILANFLGKMKKICAPNVEIEWLDTK